MKFRIIKGKKLREAQSAKESKEGKGEQNRKGDPAIGMRGVDDFSHLLLHEEEAIFSPDWQEV